MDHFVDIGDSHSQTDQDVTTVTGLVQLELDAADNDFFAELEEGYGHKTFQEWAQRGYTVDEAIAAFEADFRFGAHKLYYLAKVAKRATILLYANVDAADATKMFCAKVTDLGAVVREMAEKYGPDFTSIVIPQGGIVLPVTN